VKIKSDKTNYFKPFVWIGKGYKLAEFAEKHDERNKRKEDEDRVLSQKNRNYYEVFLYRH
jgi:hypothetical protein